jgi:hypothetical protein
LGQKQADKERESRDKVEKERESRDKVEIEKNSTTFIERRHSHCASRFYR